MIDDSNPSVAPTFGIIQISIRPPPSNGHLMYPPRSNPLQKSWYENILSVNQFEGSAQVLSDNERSKDRVSPLAAEEEISLLDLLIVIVQHRRLILKVAFGMALLSLIIVLL